MGKLDSWGICRRWVRVLHRPLRLLRFPAADDFQPPALDVNHPRGIINSKTKSSANPSFTPQRSSLIDGPVVPPVVPTQAKGGLEWATCPHREGRNDHCSTGAAPVRWEWCRLFRRPTLPQKPREGWGNRLWGDSDKDGPVGPSLIPRSPAPVQRVQAVVRSLGALDALLRMTTGGRASMGK